MENPFSAAAYQKRVLSQGTPRAYWFSLLALVMFAAVFLSVPLLPSNLDPSRPTTLDMGQDSKGAQPNSIYVTLKTRIIFEVGDKGRIKMSCEKVYNVSLPCAGTVTLRVRQIKTGASGAVLGQTSFVMPIGYPYLHSFTVPLNKTAQHYLENAGGILANAVIAIKGDKKDDTKTLLEVLR